MGVTQVLQRSTLCAFARAQPVNHPPLTVCAVFAASFSKGKPRMSKKKGGEPEPKLLLGRPSNNLKMGIVGMPNVGKSTLFNTLCKMTIPAENYPFCTIDPHVSRVEVPDERFDKLVEIFKPVSRVPAYLSVTDIAGLVKGAADGEGLGNAFLSHIKAVDGIFQVVRVFTDEDITHVEGSVEPVRDLDIISLELRLKDIEHVSNTIRSMEKRVDKSRKAEFEFYQRLLHMLEEEEVDVRTVNTWTGKEIEWLNGLQLLTAKPVVYLVNMSERSYFRKRDKWLVKVKQWIDAHGGGPIIPFCGQLEATLASMDEDQARAYLAENNAQSALSKIISVGYHALSLVHFFTCGADEVRCRTIRQGTLSPQAAGTIHTDFEKGFVCAEVMAYSDFNEAGSETACAAAGHKHQKGKTYEVIDGDIIFFKANTGGGLNKKKK